MKPSELLLIAFSLSMSFSCKEKVETPIATTTKKSIKEPKKYVQPFAEHIFSQYANVRDFTINADETEAYFSLQSPGRELSVIMKIEKKDNTWQSPQISSFSGRFTDLEPFFSPDNLKLYFVSNRPVSKDSTSTKDMDIWFVERATKTSKWSQSQNIGAPINTEADEFYPAVSSNNNLYFTCIKKELESEDDIFISKWENGSYAKPTLLEGGVDTKGAEFNAFIAPDESYIIFGGWRRPDGMGSGDLYISTNINGQWSEAKNLGAEINSKQTDFCPFVNNGTLYFTSRRSSVEMKKEGFSNTEELISEITKYENGASRIYQVDFNNRAN